MIHESWAVGIIEKCKLEAFEICGVVVRCSRYDVIGVTIKEVL